MDGTGTAGRLPDRFRSHVRSRLPLRSGDVVLVAVSGGLDSLVLLHLLRFPLADLGLRIVVAHIDHGMRPGSAADATWLRGLCTAWHLPLHVRRLEPAPGSEAEARSDRYAALEALAPERAWILTAHHADDQAETVLFRAIRGTGLRGLRGIAPRRGRLLRPLLPFRRAELAGYARGVGLRWREDPTNRELRFARNRIRHEILPALEAARPGAAAALARLADRAREAERALSAALERLEDEVVLAESEGELLLARDPLLSYDPALRAHLLRHLLRRLGSTPDRAGTRAALEFISAVPSGRTLHVAGGVRLERDFDRIRIRSASPRARAGEERRDRELVIEGRMGEGRARIGSRWIDVAWGERVPEDERGGPRSVSIPDPVLPLTVRGRRPGDRIRFDYGSKKLKALLRERRLDRRQRASTPVVVDAEGRVLWVVGVARAEGVGEHGMGFEIVVRDAGQQ